MQSGAFRCNPVQSIAIMTNQVHSGAIRRNQVTPGQSHLPMLEAEEEIVRSFIWQSACNQYAITPANARG